MSDRELDQEALAMAQPVRVFIPAKVAFNLDAMTQVVANLGRALGCEPCISGRNCMFISERDFVVDGRTFDVRGFPSFPGR